MPRFAAKIYRGRDLKPRVETSSETIPNGAVLFVE